MESIDTPGPEVAQEASPAASTASKNRSDGGSAAVAGVWSARLGKTTVRALLLVLGLILTVAAGYALWAVRLVVIPVLIALLLAAAISPLVHWLHRRQVPKTLATWISLLAVVIVLGGVLTGVVVTVSNQWNQLAISSRLGLGRLERLVAEGPLPFTAEQLRQARDAALDYLGERLSFSNAFSTLSLLSTLVVGLLLAVVILFFFLKDGRRIWEFLLQPLDAPRRSKAARAGRESLDTMGGYVRGITVIALVDAVAIGAVLFVLNVPLALPLAVIVFLGAYVPIIGATASGAFAVLVTYVANSAQDALIVAVAVIVIQQLEGNILQPLIMGRALHLHPLVVLLALTAGATLAGIAGAVLAVPLTAVAWTAAKAWQQDPALEEPLAPASG